MSEKVNIAQLKNNLSDYLEKVGRGTEIVVCKRNVPIATVTGLARKKNLSRAGWDRGNIQILDEITGITIADGDWNMLQDGPGL